MTPLLLAALIAFPIPPLGATLDSSMPAPVISEMETTQLPASGLATYYAEGVFETVIRNQIAYGNIQPGDCPQCVGYAAMLWPDDVGRTVCVQGLRLLVVDVAAGHHRAGLIAKGWVIDLQWEVWQALGYPNAPTKTTVTEC